MSCQFLRLHFGQGIGCFLCICSFHVLYKIKVGSHNHNKGENPKLVLCGGKISSKIRSVNPIHMNGGMRNNVRLLGCKNTYKSGSVQPLISLLLSVTRRPASRWTSVFARARSRISILWRDVFKSAESLLHSFGCCPANHVASFNSFSGRTIRVASDSCSKFEWMCPKVLWMAISRSCSLDRYSASRNAFAKLRGQ